MTLTTAANAIWLQSSAPWWVFLLGVFVFHEKVARRDLVPLALGALGVGIILAFELQGRARTGVAMGVASGVCFGVVIVLMRHLSSENPAWLVSLNHALAALTLLPWVLYAGHWPSATQLAVLAAFGTIQMALPYVLLIRSLRSISSQEAAAIGLVEPVLTPIWVFLTWGERPAWWTIVGASLILAGLVIRYVVLDLGRFGQPQNASTRRP
jgi:drug/metabolite transporter (DMT)-like permease